MPLVAEGVTAPPQSETTDAWETTSYGRGRRTFLVEVPHGCSSPAEFERIRRRLRGRDFPDDLISFFFVNTDVGASECAHALASELVDRLGDEALQVVVLRSRLPRTFIDCNRVADAADEAFLEAGVTQAVPDYVREPEDLATLRALHASYQSEAERLYEEICGQSGRALTLHSYAPRSVGITHVSASIVDALREAYQPEVYRSWPERPPIDILDRDHEDRLVTSKRWASALERCFFEAGFSATRSETYRLHPATTGHRHATSHPGRVVCLEIRRDLLVERFEPFLEMRIDADKLRRVVAPLADACLEILRGSEGDA